MRLLPSKSHKSAHTYKLHRTATLSQANIVYTLDLCLRLAYSLWHHTKLNKQQKALIWLLTVWNQQINWPWFGANCSSCWCIDRDKIITKNPLNSAYIIHKQFSFGKCRQEKQEKKGFYGPKLKKSLKAIKQCFCYKHQHYKYTL